MEQSVNHLCEDTRICWQEVNTLRLHSHTVRVLSHIGNGKRALPTLWHLLLHWPKLFSLHFCYWNLRNGSFHLKKKWIEIFLKCGLVYYGSMLATSVFLIVPDIFPGHIVHVRVTKEICWKLLKKIWSFNRFIKWQRLQRPENIWA